MPAQLDNGLSVAASAPINQTNFDRLTGYSNHGEDGADILAPGGDFAPGGSPFDLVLSVCSSFVCPPNFFALGSGTSFASPHAAGAAAVAIGQGEDADCVVEGADEVGPEDITDSGGRVNVVGAATCEEGGDDDDDDN